MPPSRPPSGSCSCARLGFGFLRVALAWLHVPVLPSLLPAPGHSAQGPVLAILPRAWLLELPVGLLVRGPLSVDRKSVV